MFKIYKEEKPVKWVLKGDLLVAYKNNKEISINTKSLQIILPNSMCIKGDSTIEKCKLKAENLLKGII